MLDYLARNMHEWPKSLPASVPAGDNLFEHGAMFYENHVVIPAENSSRLTKLFKQQWLDRRAELQGKPSWRAHPDAKCFVQNARGLWWKNTKTSDCRTYEHGWAIDADGSCDGFERISEGEVLGDWRDTLERRPAEDFHEGGYIPEYPAEHASCAVIDEQPLSRADALRWAVENVKTWPSVGQDVPLASSASPKGWAWMADGSIAYLSAPRCPVISKHQWSLAVEQSYEEFTSVEDAQPASLHTIHHAAFLHHDCQLLLNEPELVVFRTADGELLHCKPKECLIDPDTCGLAARLLSDMSGHAVAPEHIRELVEQMNWRV